MKGESFLGTAGRRLQSSLDGRLQDAGCKVQNAECSAQLAPGFGSRKARRKKKEGDGLSRGPLE